MTNNAATYDLTGEQAPQALLCSIAEQLKLPLLRIARQAELGRLADDTLSHDAFDDMETNAVMALRLVDSYLLGLELAEQRMELELEPVALSALLYDVAHELTPLARQRNTTIQLELAGKYGQVMAHEQGVRAALYSLGATLLETSVAHAPHHTQTSQLPVLQIAAHRVPAGIITGIYRATFGGGAAQPSAAAQKQQHAAHASQLLSGLTSQGSAGILVAESILASMHTKLRTSRFRGSRGFAATLQPSHQMQLV